MNFPNFRPYWVDSSPFFDLCTKAIAVYKEMSHNYVVIYNNFQAYRRKESVLIRQIQEELLDECYKFSTGQDISLYYQLGEAILINDLYRQVQQIKATTGREVSSAKLLAEIHNNNFGVAIRTGNFSKKIIKKAMGPKFISFVLSTYKKEEPPA